MVPESLSQDFASPPARYRPAPQWSWNSELTEARITEQLEQFAAQGCGGLFTHARPGCITGYMSERWLAAWGHALREAERLGLDFHIYDEFMCPAGHAGGLVIAERPHLAQQVLTLTAWTGVGRRPPGEVLAYVRIDPDTGAARQIPEAAAREASPSRPVWALSLATAAPRPGYGGFPAPDLTRRETAEAFITTTHARYAAQYGDHFGTDDAASVRFMFSDEPHLLGGREGLPLSRYVLRAFYDDHGYDLEDRLDALCFTQEGSAAVRYDYAWTLNRLFLENFMRPLAAWCEAHALLFTGHVMEHAWPIPRTHPDAMAALRWMHAPGNDLLGFQFRPTAPDDNGLYLLNLKELSSVVNQLERRWSLVETCGGAGYGASFAFFKPLEDYVLAFGVNVIDPHLSHTSLAGARKYDWPQTLSDHSPWWAHYRPHADHVARVNAALSQGREHNRVLVLHPTTSAWLHYPASVFGADADADPLTRLRECQIDLLWRLYGEQIDYDLGDPFIMAEFGRVEGDALCVGARCYTAVVLPSAMETWTAFTQELVATYLEGGGRVLALRAPPARVDGRRSEAPAELAARFPARWRRFDGVSELLATLRERVPPRLSAPDGRPLPAALVWRRADLGAAGALYFFCNPWTVPLRAEVRLDGRGLWALDTATGEIVPASARQEDGGLIATLGLPPQGHALWLCTPEPSPAPAPPPRATPCLLELVDIERRAPNLLMLDYCDLMVGDRTLTDVNTVQADTANWRWQGFARNPWRQARQFKRTVIDRPVGPESGFAVRYRFTVAEDLPAASRASLCLGVERPWLYDVRLNDVVLATSDAPRWFDEHARAVPIGAHVRAGENVLTLTARPFDVLCEIMPVYLLGDFALAPAARGFRVVAPRPLTLGDWTEQGLPFYPDAVRYTFDLMLPAAGDALRVHLGAWEGAVTAVALDGVEGGAIMHPPFTLVVPGPMAAGRHTLVLDVIGSMGNMMGPHHVAGLPGAWTWEASPRAQPPGSAYRVEACGLLAPPTVAVLEEADA
jgi:hypothetical protein